MNNIRNFLICAHVDHGKSTLADRFLEITGTVEKRKMQAQYLDQLELERERGITIKMAPVRMNYKLGSNNYILNLIDTPGHSDFAYEVSRALAAVEGAILLVDAAQGIQAQTLANFRAAKNAGLKITGAVNKVDLALPDLEDLIDEVAELIGCPSEQIHKVSGKTGQGVKELLAAVIERVPPPDLVASSDFNSNMVEVEPQYIIGRALIFDSFYDDHKGVVVSVRVFDGQFTSSQDIRLVAGDVETKIKELGYFTPQLKPADRLKSGEIGYIATGIKDPEKIKIGDTILIQNSRFKIQNFQKYVLPGYKEPQPVVFVSFYPDDADDYELLKRGLQQLKLNDSALTFEPDQQEVLGRGFKVGFLGRLHFEITAERLKRELNIKTIQSFPSVAYRVKLKDEIKTIIKPEDLPDDYQEILEPTAKIEIILPDRYLSKVLAVVRKFRIAEAKTETLGDRIKISGVVPVAELVSDFDDQLKSASQGFTSFSYELFDYQKADVVKVEFLVAGEVVPGLSRFLPRESFEYQARQTVEKLKKLLPRQQFAQAIQARADGRIIVREDIPALRKDVTGYLYGGDRTRKMKLWQKQKRGKEKLKTQARVRIPADVFKELLKR